MKRWIYLLGVLTLSVAWACSSVPPEKPEAEKIKRDADRGYGSLEAEEERREKGR
jgi:hypothetical protein